MIASPYNVALALISDTNECSIANGGCEDVCINTNGSYLCDCQDGFELSTDGHNCTGMLITTVDMDALLWQVYIVFSRCG